MLCLTTQFDESCATFWLAHPTPGGRIEGGQFAGRCLSEFQAELEQDTAVLHYDRVGKGQDSRSGPRKPCTTPLDRVWQVRLGGVSVLVLLNE